MFVELIEEITPLKCEPVIINADRVLSIRPIDKTSMKMPPGSRAHRPACAICMGQGHTVNVIGTLNKVVGEILPRTVKGDS